MIRMLVMRISLVMELEGVMFLLEPIIHAFAMGTIRSHSVTNASLITMEVVAVCFVMLSRTVQAMVLAMYLMAHVCAIIQVLKDIGMEINVKDAKKDTMESTVREVLECSDSQMMEEEFKGSCIMNPMSMMHGLNAPN